LVEREGIGGVEVFEPNLTRVRVKLFDLGIQWVTGG
jgi:hypothetical protein